MTHIYTHSARLVAVIVLIALAVTSVIVSPGVARAACGSTALGQVAYGMSGAAVSALQSCLIEAGFAIPAGVTGYYGAQTKAAVSQFYAAHLALPSWDGMSVGPLGREKLASIAGAGGTPAPGGLVGATYKRAGSATELAKYLTAATEGNQGILREVVAVGAPMAPTEDSSSDRDESAGRVSETNVQVAGIDEPDIVKTDGKNIYISKEGMYYGRPVPMMGAVEDRAILPPDWEDSSVTSVVEAFPVERLAEIGEIKEKGEMLLVKDADILVILSHPEIVAYDISTPKSPKKQWSLALEDNTSLITARLKDNTLYFVTQTWLDRSQPCPYIPVVRGTVKIAIPCGDVWVPTQIEPVQHAFTVLSVNPETGATTNSLSLAADAGNTTVAVFENNLYLATKSYAAPYQIMIPVSVAAVKPYLSATAMEKITRIQGYDISSGGKLSEINKVVEGELALLSANERLATQTKIENEVRAQLETKKRELDRTRITRIALSDLSVAASGEVPGTLLNQFALDEYEGNLRVAVTVGENVWWDRGGESANDVYVLGQDLAVKGSVVDLGLTERIYAVRFMGDTAYVVTFRQIDPFYVLNLSIPTAPKMVGELKIPGYSAYLEALGNDLVLGVGREGNAVKLSLFDVSNPAKPVEKSKYMLSESWTEVEGNHRAFLKDAEHNVFFIPASQGGYVLSYAGGELTLKATVAGWSVKRAVYLDDYLYIIGNDAITVLDENTWKEAKTLKLK